MRMYHTLLLSFTIMLCIPMALHAEDADVDIAVLSEQISKATDIKSAGVALRDAVEQIIAVYTEEEVTEEEKREAKQRVEKHISDTESGFKDNRTDAQREKDLADKQKAYDDAKEKENSTANKLLTAGSMATMGIGAMELARGLSEQKADKEADADMAAYIETFRCTYGKDKSVKAGPQEIELPGGNDQNIMKYRSEYLALAPDLKARKEALGLKPGIESEEILDKTQMGLYDQENVGITSGNYESLYRAKMLGSEADKAKINDNAEASKRRVIAGAVVGGVGLVGSVVGNSLINGKLGELIKENKQKRNAKLSASIDRDEVIKTLTETELQTIRTKYFSKSE